MIRLAKPYITDAALESITEVVKSGNLVQGPRVAEFEAHLQKFLNVEHAVIVSSGTAALHLAMMALGIGPEDEVIVPAFTYPATANAVEVTGAKAILADISLEDYCIDPQLAAEKVSSKTKVIVPVHEFGQPANCQEILELSKQHQISVVEDAACALGAKFGEQMIGSLGAIACFSLHPRKAITTGEGGILTTNSSRLAEKLRALRNHGISFVDGLPDFSQAGLNYRMTDFQAALGISQLEAIDYLYEKRLAAARFYESALEGISWLSIPKTFPERKMVYQSYHVLLDDSINRDELISQLRERGIETNLGAQNLAGLSYYMRKYSLRPEDFPAADKANKQGLVLPLGEHLSEADLEYVANTLASF